MLCRSLTLLSLAAVAATVVLGPSPVRAEEANVLVGDPINGKKLYIQECAACHGDDGTGGRSGYALTAGDRLNLIRDDQMFAMIQAGKGLEKPDKHTFREQLKFLQIWDSIAHVRSLHMTLDQFFPSASRYITKVYEIDKNGLKRIQTATGRRPKETKAAVFTFFDFEGEGGNLTFVPQDPILLDKLNKDKKAGYLVFMPFEHGDFKGREVGIAMDTRGVITKVAVHPGLPGAADINTALERLVGQGRLGQRGKFKVSGPRDVKALAEVIFPLYMRAMETVTQYIVEERERTWADDAVQ